MKIPELRQDIVEDRRQKAQPIQAIMESCRGFRKKLEDVSSALNDLSETDSSELLNPKKEIQSLITGLDELYDRAKIRHDRFKKGMVTVSIAGLEKAGKTTFLRSLTGIEALPAFDERCTAVCCEIHHSEDRSDFDIEFYSEKEFCERVLHPLLETVFADLPDSVAVQYQMPGSAADFIHMNLPSPDLVSGGTTAYKLLRDLQQLQQHFSECRMNLGKEPILRRPMDELNEWVSHRPSLSDDQSINAEKARGRHLARVSAVKVCRVYTPFQGGSPYLRWIDTPGVDDPNRRARDLTLSTIARDTDLLVVASRPGANPSPGESFHNFWDSASRLPDEIDLLSRLLFVLNWDKRVDPEGHNIKIHRKYLMDAGVPSQLFVDPYEATQPSDAIKLMERVNRHLGQHLSDQDEKVIAKIETRMKNILARIRLLHSKLSAFHPSDSDQQDLETEAFHRWFHWYHGDKDTGFWTNLVELLDRSARAISKDPRIKESETSLNNIFAGEAEKIQSQIPTAKELEDFVVKHRGENPIPHGMRTISTHFSRLINHLSDEMQEFGPIMQDEVVDLLVKSGLENLMDGKSSADKLKSLIDHFAAGSLSVAQNSSVLDVLRETLELPRNLKYVIRYELRGAVDFCDPTLWDENESAWKRLVDMIRSNNGDPERLAKFDTNRHPPVTDSREQDSIVLKKIAGNAMLGIHSVLNNERYLPKRIADDFMRDCRVRLCFGPESEQEWRALLFRNRSKLLVRTIGQIRDQSERIRAFQLALSKLQTDLP